MGTPRCRKVRHQSMICSMPGVSDNMLRTECGRFHNCLNLGMPVNWCHVENVQDATDRSITNKIVYDIGIHARCGDD